MTLFGQARVLFTAILCIASGVAGAQSITLSSTTSTEQSGLFAHLLPLFKQASGLDVKVVAVGTGQALDIARRGDADALLVHDQAAEEKFVAEGWGLKRYPVMYNDFVLVGPKTDPAATRGSDIVAALGKISAGNAAFISRGDKSGTHAAENRYWTTAGLASQRGSGYKECGCGMGPALNIAAASGSLRADRSRHLACIQEPRRPHHSRRRRQAPVQPVRRDRRESGEASACQGRAGSAVCRLDDLARRDKRRSLPTRSVENSSSSRTRASSAGQALRAGRPHGYSRRLRDRLRERGCPLAPAIRSAVRRRSRPSRHELRDDLRDNALSDEGCNRFDRRRAHARLPTAQ